MRLLQNEPGRVVALENGGSVVRKTYVGGDPDVLGAMAVREFERMSVFRDALRECTGATCPRPLELALGRQPYIRMTRATGIAMEDSLKCEVWSAARFARVGDILCRAVDTYVRTFDEPYWDFILRNMLYDPEKQLVTFIDYEIPPACLRLLDTLSRFSPLDFSVGTLVASSIFEPRRPRRLFRRRQHRQASALVRAAVRSFRNPPGVELKVAQVREVAHLNYELATGGGNAVRRVWYKSAALLSTDPATAIREIADIAYVGR
jgi:hypothetical protein